MRRERRERAKPNKGVAQKASAVCCVRHVANNRARRRIAPYAKYNLFLDCIHTVFRASARVMNFTMKLRSGLRTLTPCEVNIESLTPRAIARAKACGRWRMCFDSRLIMRIYCSEPRRYATNCARHLIDFPRDCWRRTATRRGTRANMRTRLKNFNVAMCAPLRWPRASA